MTCNTDKSVERASDQNHWYNYKDPVTHQTVHVCMRCNNIVNGTKPRYHIPPDRKCSKCGSYKTEVSKEGYAHWFDDGKGGFWCRKYYRKDI
jgi:hypothetical protein